MKTIIRWFADISGVTQDIQIESIKMVGGCMYQNAFWWNGGIMYQRMNPGAWNSFFLYSEALKLGNHSPNMMQIRDEVYLMAKENRTIDPNSPVPITHQPHNPDIQEYVAMTKRLNNEKWLEGVKRIADRDNLVKNEKLE